MARPVRLVCWLAIGFAITLTAAPMAAATPAVSTITVTYTFDTGDTAATPSIVTTEAPDWQVTGSTVEIVTDGPDYEPDWHHSLGQADTWIVEESVGPDATVRVRVTYDVPPDATGDYRFEARAEIDDEWIPDRETVTVDQDVDPELRVEPADAHTEPNRSATVGLTVTNGGDEAVVLGVNVTDRPPGWTVVGQSPDGGTWAEQRTAWFWTAPLAPNASVSPAVTLSVPADTPPGTYPVVFEAVTDSGSASATATVTVRANRTVLEAIAGDDGTVGFGDVLRAIRWFNDGTPAPGTGGDMVAFADVLDAISAFNAGGGA